MRDILFRGKCIDNVEWVYGVFWPNTSLSDLTISRIIDCDGTAHKVDHSTVGQWTGLTDKNGKRIFEGDIMEFDAYGLHYKGVVSFVAGNFGVMCNRPNASPFLDVAIKQHDAICVGNIHDNLELMEGDD